MTTANLELQDNNTVDSYISVGESQFFFTFPVTAAAELTVSKNQALLVYGVDYSLDSGSLDNPLGGSITLATASTAGDQLVLWLDMPIERLSGFTGGAATLLPEDLNADAVRELRVNQMLRRDLGRSLRIPVDDPVAGQSMQLPYADERKGRVPAFSPVDGKLELLTLAELGASTVSLTRSILGIIIYPRTAEELSASVVPTDYAYPPGHVHRYGAVGDGVADDVAAIRAAVAVVAVAGGVVTFEARNYLLVDTTIDTVVEPVSAPDYQAATQNHPFHIRIVDAQGITFAGNGATLTSTYEFGGEMILLDGVRGFRATNITLVSPHTYDTDGVNIVTGMNGWGITSQNRDSYDITLEGCALRNVYTGIYVFGDPASLTRVRGVNVLGLSAYYTHYTLATHDNGDQLFARGVITDKVLREYFAYGVNQADVEVFSSGAVGGFGSNIKAYSRDTSSIRYKLVTTRNITAPSNVHLQSQHAPSVQAAAARVFDITLDVYNKGAVGVGVGVSFQYHRDSTLTATSASNLFSGIVLKGVHEQAPIIDVVQAVVGTLNIDDMILLNGSAWSLFSGNGFRDPRQTYHTFTPVVRIGGSTTGITLHGSSVGEMWRDGQWLEVLYTVTLTSKGVAAGSVSLDLPKVSASTISNALVVGYADNVDAVSSVLTGFVQSAGTLISLRMQGASGSSSLLAANLTDTTVLKVHARYPI